MFVLFNVCFGLVCGEVKRTDSGILFPFVLIFLPKVCVDITIYLVEKNFHSPSMAVCNQETFFHG